MKYNTSTPGFASSTPAEVQDSEHDALPLYIAVERVPWFQSALEKIDFDPPPVVPEKERLKTWSREDAFTEIVRGRIEMLGPITAQRLATELNVEVFEIDKALLALESQGVVLRGNFSPVNSDTRDPAPETRNPILEWCDRRLLARIHRYTLDRLRREIEPVSARDYMRFLFNWQHAAPGAQLEGPRGVSESIAQLQGFEIAAAAWERDVLPARIKSYDRHWLDQLSLSGEISWGRRFPPKPDPEGGRHSGQVRGAPIGIFLRDQQEFWLSLATDLPADEAHLSSAARAVLDLLRKRGAMFFQNLVRDSRRLPVEIESALGELVAFGLVTCDGFGGLRALLLSAAQRRRLRRRSGTAGFQPAPGTAGILPASGVAGFQPASFRRPYARGGHPLHIVKPHRAASTLESAGRWSLFRGDNQPNLFGEASPDEINESVARQLLRRWGIVFHKVVSREKGLPQWLDLLRVYRRLEARGEIRGGRFVAGFSGEQYALAEAVERVRAVRDSAHDNTLISISGADPLNLAGIITPGERIAARSATRILFKNGIPAAVKESGQIRILEHGAEPADEAALRAAFLRKAI